MWASNTDECQGEDRRQILFRCRFCETNEKCRILSLTDIMYGTGRWYEYVECTRCYSLQILKIPSDMKEHYPDNYRPHFNSSQLRSLFFTIIDWLILSGPETLALMLNIFGIEENTLRALKARGYSKDSRVLEIGCGSGRVLKALRKRGFRNIIAADPFVSEVQSSGLPFKVLRKDISDVYGTYDLIIANHVFEHLPDPIAFFFHIKRLMSPNGELVLLTPIANSVVWKLFRENWVQADAPRHLNIPSLVAIESLAHKFNLNVKQHYFNGTEFQLLGSEQCAQGISLMSPYSAYSGGVAKRISLILSRIKLWKRIQNWNRQRVSDQAVFFFGNK